MSRRPLSARVDATCQAQIVTREARRAAFVAYMSSGCAETREAYEQARIADDAAWAVYIATHRSFVQRCVL